MLKTAAKSVIVAVVDPAAQNWNGALPQQFVPGSTLPMPNLGVGNRPQ